MTLIATICKYETRIKLTSCIHLIYMQPCETIWSNTSIYNDILLYCFFCINLQQYVNIYTYAAARSSTKPCATMSNHAEHFETMCNNMWIFAHMLPTAAVQNLAQPCPSIQSILKQCVTICNHMNQYAIVYNCSVQEHNAACSMDHRKVFSSISEFMHIIQS